MEIISSLCAPSSVNSVTIGFFDGCHLGHKTVLEALTNLGGTSAVITFHPHPQEIVLHTSPKCITPTLERLRYIAQYQPTYLIVLPFTSALAKQAAEEFLYSLHQKLRIKRLVLGYDSKFGCDGCGIDALHPIASKYGIEIIEVPPYRVEGKIVSSQAIRQFLAVGNFVEAKRYLGRPYTLTGAVIHGIGMGAHLGSATLNIRVENPIIPLGVYICEAVIQGKNYPAVMNLGKAPTMRNSLCLEVHLLTLSCFLYGKNVEVIPLQFVREEVHFSSKADLTKAIQHDIAKAKAFFNLVV